MDTYAIVNEKIINLLEQSVIPWRKPWASIGLPRNLVSWKPYRGVSIFLLSASKYISPFWLTLRQANQLGGHVRKREESSIVTFCKVEDLSYGRPRPRLRGERAGDFAQTLSCVQLGTVRAAAGCDRQVAENRGAPARSNRSCRRDHRENARPAGDRAHRLESLLLANHGSRHSAAARALKRKHLPPRMKYPIAPATRRASGEKGLQNWLRSEARFSFTRANAALRLPRATTCSRTAPTDPCVDEFYRAALDSLPSDKDREFNVLDLGAGTGIVSALLAYSFPHVLIILEDVSREMLAQAQQRLVAGGDRFQFKTADYETQPIEGRYDAVVSALSIHHLKDNSKTALSVRFLIPFILPVCL